MLALRGRALDRLIDIFRGNEVTGRALVTGLTDPTVAVRAISE